MINTVYGPVYEALLQKRTDVIDNDNERTEATEYCFIACLGKAHKTGVPDSESHFCNNHVSRSVHVALKKWPGATISLGDFLHG